MGYTHYWTSRGFTGKEWSQLTSATTAIIDRAKQSGIEVAAPEPDGPARLNDLLEQGERKVRALENEERAVLTLLNPAVGTGELATLRSNLEKLKVAADFHQGLGLEPNGDAVPAMLVRVARQLTDADNVVAIR